MEVRPGYKQTDVGVIPEDWDVKHLGDLASVVRGSSPRPAGDPRYFDGRFIPWLTVASLTNIPGEQLLVSETASCLTEEGSRRSRTLPAGTVIVANSGATLGVAKLLDIRCCANDGIAALVQQRAGAKAFVCHYVNTLTQRLREVIASGNGQPNLNTRLIRDIGIPFPRVEEQHAIAGALGEVDALLAGLRRLIAKKRDLKQAAMQQLLTGQARLPGFHGDWTRKRFAEIAGPRRDRVDPRRTGARDFCLELEHVASSTSKLVGSTTTGNNTSLKSIFRAGDVLFAKLRAYLRKHWLATRSGVCSTEFWVLAPTEHVASGFLLHVVSTDHFVAAAGNAYGTHMPRSDWNVVRNYELDLPGMAEQIAIATVLSDMDAELVALEARREKTRALKQAMMQELLTGRIRLV